MKLYIVGWAITCGSISAAGVTAKITAKDRPRNLCSTGHETEKAIFQVRRLGRIQLVHMQYLMSSESI